MTADRFTAVPLDPRRIDQAYPVVQAVMPDIAAAEWRGYAASLLGRDDRGIMVLQDPAGYLHGLFAYAAVPHLGRGRVLRIECFVALGLLDRDGPAAALLRAAEDVARRLGCRAVQTETPEVERANGGYRDWLFARLRRAGHLPGPPQYSKPLNA